MQVVKQRLSSCCDQSQRRSDRRDSREIHSSLCLIMEQVFESLPSHPERESLLLQLCGELQNISKYCPEGEKTLQRLLDVIQELVVPESSSQSVRSADEDQDHFSDLIQRITLLEREVTEAKEKTRQICRQLNAAEEENIKLLEENNQRDKQLRDAFNQITKLRDQNDDQILELNERLQREQATSEKLRQTFSRHRCSGQKHVSEEHKSLAHELAETRADASVQTDEPVLSDLNSNECIKTMDLKTEKLCKTVVSNILIISSKKQQTQGWKWMTIFISVIVSVSSLTNPLQLLVHNNIIDNFHFESPPPV